MRTRLFPIVITLLACFGTPLYGADIHVPLNQPTIQAGINVAVDGDTVLVAAGTYTENLDLDGKAITVRRASTSFWPTIDGNQAGPVITFDNGECKETVIDGFTIYNGASTNGGGAYCYEASPTFMSCAFFQNSSTRGGGLYCASSSPRIQDSMFRENDADWGGGLYSTNSSPFLKNSDFLSNTADQDGGGIYCAGSPATTIACAEIAGNSAAYGGGIACYASSPAFWNVLIVNNGADFDGGGIWCTAGASAEVTNCTITDNTAVNNGGGIHADGSSLTVINSILWNDTAPTGVEIYETISGSVAVTYSDVEGGWTGAGNIDADPAFVGEDDFHLDTGSPCIDSGTPSGCYFDVSFPPSQGTQRNDMGAYGGTVTCSCSRGDSVTVKAKNQNTEQVIENADVTLTDADNFSHYGTTNQDGCYTFLSFSAGTITIEVSCQGYYNGSENGAIPPPLLLPIPLEPETCGPRADVPRDRKGTNFLYVFVGGILLTLFLLRKNRQSARQARGRKAGQQ